MHIGLSFFFYFDLKKKESPKEKRNNELFTMPFGHRIEWLIRHTPNLPAELSQERQTTELKAAIVLP